MILYILMNKDSYIKKDDLIAEKEERLKILS